MRISRILMTAAAAVPILAAAPVGAHHAFAAEFDANQPVRFTATVKRVRWTNPHTWFFVEVAQPDGTVEEWAIEAGTPNVLYRRGFTKDSLAPGTEVIIDGYRAKDGSRRANGRDITLPDGRTLFMTSPRTGAPGP